MGCSWLLQEKTKKSRITEVLESSTIDNWWPATASDTSVREEDEMIKVCISFLCRWFYSTLLATNLGSWCCMSAHMCMYDLCVSDTCALRDRLIIPPLLAVVGVELAKGEGKSTTLTTELDTFLIPCPTCDPTLKQNEHSNWASDYQWRV